MRRTSPSPPCPPVPAPTPVQPHAPQQHPPRYFPGSCQAQAWPSVTLWDRRSVPGHAVLVAGQPGTCANVWGERPPWLPWGQLRSRGCGAVGKPASRAAPQPSQGPLHSKNPSGVPGSPRPWPPDLWERHFLPLRAGTGCQQCHACDLRPKAGQGSLGCPGTPDAPSLAWLGSHFLGSAKSCLLGAPAARSPSSPNSLCYPLPT